MIKIQSYQHEYFVNFYDKINDLILYLNKKYNIKKTYFIIDKNIIKNIPWKGQLFESIEKNKSMVKICDFYQKLLKFNINKGNNIILIGGGILGDVVGFLCSTYMRGLDFIYIPTTLLAQCDSCIGSKNSINFKNRKNILGTFYPPKEVLICSEFLNTLSDKDYRSGLGELFKYSLLNGKKSFINFKKNIDNILKNKNNINNFIKKGLIFKKKFIEKDEFDRGIRKILNFGHTFGHAIESYSNFAIPHGQAVILGIIIANKISLKLSLLSQENCTIIENIAFKILSKEFHNFKFEYKKLFNYIKNDKKSMSDNIINMILLDDNFFGKIISVDKKFIYSIK